MKIINLNNNLLMIKRAIKKRDLKYKILCKMLIKMGFSNYLLQELQIRNKKSIKIKKKYSKYLEKKEFIESEEYNEEGIDNVWICWLQGLDKAPDLVKMCINSAYEHMPKKKIHIITKNNIFDYIDIPDYIIYKWNKGIISNTHFSDILRTALLVKNGGMWIDATAFLTDEIPSYIYTKKLFLFGFKFREDITIKNNNWFIFARKGNRTMKIVLELLLKYWENENRVEEYFLWHIFAKIAMDKYPDDYKDIYYVSDEMAHMLKYNLFNQYTDEYWEQLKRFSTIHKLSYKMTIPENVDGTFYKYLLDSRMC